LRVIAAAIKPKPAPKQNQKATLAQRKLTAFPRERRLLTDCVSWPGPTGANGAIRPQIRKFKICGLLKNKYF
jgi:hypothetical protein